MSPATWCEGAVCVEKLTLAMVPPARDQRRGPATYNGPNYTVRHYGVVRANVQTVDELYALDLVPDTLLTQIEAAE